MYRRIELLSKNNHRPETKKPLSWYLSCYFKKKKNSMKLLILASKTEYLFQEHMASSFG